MLNKKLEKIEDIAKKLKSITIDQDKDNCSFVFNDFNCELWILNNTIYSKKIFYNHWLIVINLPGMKNKRLPLTKTIEEALIQAEQFINSLPFDYFTYTEKYNEMCEIEELIYKKEDLISKLRTNILELRKKKKLLRKNLQVYYPAN